MCPGIEVPQEQAQCAPGNVDRKFCDVLIVPLACDLDDPSHVHMRGPHEPFCFFLLDKRHTFLLRWQ